MLENRLPYFFIVASSLLHAYVQAEEVEVHGFIAQGLIQAPHSNYVDDEGDLSFDLTEAGVNASYRLTPSLRVAGQAVYLNAGNRYAEGARIDYLFADWTAINTLDTQLNVHVGRYKNYHWYYSSIQDVPHARPSIILAQSAYIDAFRDVALGSDGVGLIWQKATDNGEWEVDWSYGTANISREQMQNLLSDIAQGELNQDFVHQFSVKYRDVMSNWQVGFSLLDSDFTYDATPDEILYSGDAVSQRIMVYGVYNWKNLEIVSELMRERAIYNGILSPDFFNQSVAEGGYVQAKYHFSADLSITARLDLYDRDKEDRDGTRLSQMSGGTIPSYFGYMDQAMLGVSYDFAENWRVQAEVHRVKGAGRLAPLLAPDPIANDRKYWNIFALHVMHWF
ncbi:TonB-dependent receptor [Aestuariibacter sp. AA17]|uniref:TonB-dependent receptor n=1 Tax=Fluctibacter corallii TaxID=2984329 RepID=A0ABT3ABW0_9ALTE|nr:TonB-dependent receptor [Aestuariibacter sp. AA17]MCV2886165.1 TonB-dependent receptor [Aestuariibacter sp. AA17]